MNGLRRERKWNVAVAVLILTIGMLGVVGCGAPDGASMGASEPAEAVPSDAENLDPAAVEELVRNDEVVLVDVREADEWDAGHIDGAILIPLGELEDRMSELPTDRPIVTMCRTGRRSAQAVRMLERAGFEGVRHLDGGIRAWQRSGRPVDRGRR